MNKTNEKISILKEKYDLQKNDFWSLERSGRHIAWILKHDAVEKIAKMENIVFENPEVKIAERDCCVLFGTASKIPKDKKEIPLQVWTFGEADNKTNCRMGYPYAMA